MVKQNFLTKILLLCALIVGSVSASWADDVVETIDFTTGSPSVSTYGDTSTWGNWTVVGGANNGGKWAYLRIGGGKSNSSPSTITGTEQLTQAVDYIEIVHQGRSNSNFSITSIVVETSSSTDFSNPISTTTVSNPDISSTGKIIITPSSQIAANSYYKITINWTSSGSSNMGLNTETIKFYKKGSAGNTWSVTYNGNGNTSGSVPNDNTEYNSTNNTVTVLGNTGTLAKTGYTFSDWNTKADGTGTGYEEGDEFEISANTILFAQWTVNTHNVTLPTADAYGTYTISATNPVAYGTEVTLTYTPADSYENYQATWSVNGTAISGDSFTMPDEDVTVTVKVEEAKDYATLPFNWAGGTSADLEALNGVTVNADKSDYAEENAPYRVKFNGTGKYILIKTDSQPGVVTMGVKMIGGNSTSTITVQGSADGENYRDIETLTISGKTNDVVNLTSTKVFDAADRYVKLYYTKGSNVGVGPITISQATSDPVIDSDATVDLAADATYGEFSYTIINPVDGTSLTAAEESDWISDLAVLDNKVTFTTSANNVSTVRSAVITLTYGSLTKDVIVTQAAYIAPVDGKYVKVTSTDDITDGQYLIVSEEGSVAFDGGLTTLDAVGNTIAVAIENEEISATTTTCAAEFTIDAGTIKSASGFYIGETSDANGLASSTETVYTNTLTIDEDGDADIVASGGAYLRYNANSGQERFRYFKSSTYSSQKAIQLYKFVSTAEPVSVTVSQYKWATFSSDKALDFTNSNVKAYIVTGFEGTAITKQQVNVVPANTGLLLNAEANTYDIPVATGTTEDVSANKLNAVLGQNQNVSAAVEPDVNYVLSVKSGKVVFAWIGSTSATVKAGQAYLTLENGPKPGSGNAPWLSIEGDDETTGIQSIERTMNDNQYYTLDGRRVAQPTKGLYIVNGKKVLVP